MNIDGFEKLKPGNRLKYTVITLIFLIICSGISYVFRLHERDVSIVNLKPFEATEQGAECRFSVSFQPVYSSIEVMLIPVSENAPYIPM